ncbi:MAG: alpha-N-acetylglucosaminidase N-terminal domain-containing protein [Alistipes sp.]
MAVGLNQYLKNVCHASVSWFAHDTVSLPNTFRPLLGNWRRGTMRPAFF